MCSAIWVKLDNQQILDDIKLLEIGCKILLLADYGGIQFTFYMEIKISLYKTDNSKMS